MNVNKESIKRIIFDIDDTLIDWKEEYWNSINKTFEELNIEYSKKDIEKVKKAIDIYEDGRNETYNKEKMQKTIEDELGYKLPEDFMEVWMNYLGKCVPEKIDENIFKTLEYLQEKYELVVLSNWLERSQMLRLKNAKLDKYFKEFYITEGIKMKPSKESFNIAKGDRIETECVMVGDNLKSDIKGAINAGMQAIYLNKKNNLIKMEDKKVSEILKISDLMEIL